MLYPVLFQTLSRGFGLAFFGGRLVDLVERLFLVAFAPPLVLEADNPLTRNFSGQNWPFFAFGFINPQRAEPVVYCIGHSGNAL